MRRLLAGAALGWLLLAAPHHALAFDYAAPAVPAAYGGPTDSAPPNDPLRDAYTSPQSVPNDPAFVPHSVWEDGDGGGCALWNWNSC